MAGRTREREGEKLVLLESRQILLLDLGDHAVLHCEPVVGEAPPVVAEGRGLGTKRVLKPLRVGDEGLRRASRPRAPRQPGWPPHRSGSRRGRRRPCPVESRGRRTRWSRNGVHRRSTPRAYSAQSRRLTPSSARCPSASMVRRYQKEDWSCPPHSRRGQRPGGGIPRVPSSSLRFRRAASGESLYASGHPDLSPA